MKKVITYICSILLCILCVSCSVQKEDHTKVRDVDFTVMDKADVPEEMQKEIRKVQKSLFQLTYADEGFLYVAKGYGEQKTSGYSVKIEACYESKDAVKVIFGLTGPKKGEKIVESDTCPYAVIKMEYTEKPVEFEEE